MLVHHSSAVAGNLGIAGLHAAHGRGIKVYQISTAIQLLTAGRTTLTDATSGLVLAVDGANVNIHEEWGHCISRVSGADTLKTRSFVFPNGIIIQELAIGATAPTAADWFIHYKNIG